MLKITIPKTEAYNEALNEFIDVPETNLSLEHSLVSISKWESKFCKPFFGKEDKTDEELMYYVQCMTINNNVDPDVYKALSLDNLKDIKAYIEAPMTATTFNKMNNRPSREIITSELIYYSMIAEGIPFECQKWHINRLLTLIRVCAIKNTPSKKMGKSEIASQYRALNASRRAALGTKG